jgi:hypothetical protein
LGSSVIFSDGKVHCHRNPGRARGGDVIETRILHSGALRLTPPGLELDIADLFGPPEM